MKTQIGICYICNCPIYDVEKYKKVGIEMMHTSQKCSKEALRRSVCDLPTRHPDYIKPIPIPVAPKVVPVIVIPPLDTTCKFCNVEMEKIEEHLAEGVIRNKDTYQCPKCRKTSTEEELRKGGTNGTSDISREV